MSELFHSPWCVGWITEDMCYRREHGPCMIYTEGAVYFSQTNIHTYNRQVGPAKIYSEGTIVYQNKHGQCHRTDGPAIIRRNGHKEYYINDSELAPEEFFLKYGVV